MISNISLKLVLVKNNPKIEYKHQQLCDTPENIHKLLLTSKSVRAVLAIYTYLINMKSTVVQQLRLKILESK